MVINGQPTFKPGDHVHPGGRVDLHDRVWNEYNMHPIEHRTQHGVPQANLQQRKRCLSVSTGLKGNVIYLHDAEE